MMQKNDNIKKISIIELVLFVGWCVIVLAFADYERAGFYFWGGFGFGVFSFILAGISLFLLQMKNNANLTEINYIPVYLTIIYLAISVLINSFFVYCVTGSHNSVLAILNLIVSIVFICFRMYTNNYAVRVEEQTSYAADKIRPLTDISAQLATILGVTGDPEIKKQVYQLKEMVDYSSNVAQRASEGYLEQFRMELEELQNMILAQKDKDEIMKVLQSATMTWKMRNSMETTLR